MKLPYKNVKNHANFRFSNSVRPDPAAPGPRKLRVVFPLISVLSKPPQLQYGPKYCFGVGARRDLRFKSWPTEDAHGVVGHLQVQNCTCELGAPPKKHILPHIAIKGVLTRQK